MKAAANKHRLKWNSLLWVLAMAMPAFFHLVLSGTRFPWPLIFPLLLFGPMLASNRMLAEAASDATSGQDPE
jgi:hypothetical protein